MSLKEYTAKRNFRHTREPKGARVPARSATAPFFVVQKHDATRLHYDFRLEMGGTLKSWAVPKGFPTTHGDRRLAVQVEDHPIDYAQFEGTIPRGNYGAGTVMVWDLGAYDVSGDPARALREGKLHLTLHGKKLKGEWTLVRMRPREHGTKPQWLLLKSGEDMQPLSPRAENRSVLTHRSMDKIAADNDSQWQSDRPRKAAVRVSRERPGSGRTASSHLKDFHSQIKTPRLPKRRPVFVEPMKALLAEELPKGPEWTYEIKFDGVRALALKTAKTVELISRNAKDFTGRFREVAEALKKLPCREAILDGEIVALDREGRSSFQLLQAHRLPGAHRPPIFYYVFDLIQLDGKDLTGLPLFKRKATAEALLKNLPDSIRYSAGIQADTTRMQAEMKARGLEGLIAKRKDSIYEAGRRSGAWVKFKWTHEQEFVIGGYSAPQGTRQHFGALLVGYYQGKKLLFASKVGTGFTQKVLSSLFQKFQKWVRQECPFSNLPEKAGAHGRGLTVAEMKRCQWLEPKFVCQIRFAEWTRDGHLRQPAFLGLREDKKAEDVVREKASK